MLSLHKRTALLCLAVFGVSESAGAWTTLASGDGMRSGSISSTLRWQSSGELYSGGCNSAWGIKNCYSIRVGGAGTNLQSTTATRSKRARTFEPELSLVEQAAADDDDLESYARAFPQDYFPNFEHGSLEKRQVVLNCTGGGGGGNGTEPPPPPSPRQRVEFMSWGGAPAGQTWKYTWKTRQAPTSSSYKFNHIWQILRRDACGGAVVTLDLIADNVVIRDNVRKCPNNTCATAPASSWFNKVISHTLIIRYGINGSLNYAAMEAGKAAPSIIKYHATGDMGHLASLKSGVYRASYDGMTASQMWLGQWVATRVS
ncbi:hypothetical protein OIO90_002316 [Microbotryomycetes sp. JL221]|nr:hypothetical protein OIO90_002316 [Microbotryomycetes sp. JL221]